MKTTVIDINELKQNAVHTGLLETMVLLNEARGKVNAISDEYCISLNSEWGRKLEEISESVCAFECDIARIIGMILTDRVEEFVENTQQITTLKSLKR